MNTKNTPIPRTVFGLIEFAPILVFSYLGSAASTSLRTRFLISGSLALLVLVAQRVIKWPMNSLALSANIFLLLEGAAFITSMAPVARVLRFVGESALFVVTLVVGVIRTFASARGFLDLADGQGAAARRGSLYLLVGTGGALGISIVFHGRPALSAALPFVGLLALRRVLREIASRHGADAE